MRILPSQSASLPRRQAGVVIDLLHSALRRDSIAAVVLFLLGTISRLPFQSHILYHWDSVNFAFALELFDVTADQPQMPGYILYVYLARAINWFVGDPQKTMVGLSIVSSGLAVALLFKLGTAMFNRVTGLLAALFLASSPLFWFYGEVALPHSLDAFIVIAVVLLLYQVVEGRSEKAILAAIALGVAGGLRPQTQVFLMPLAFFAGWRLGWRRGLLALVVLALVDLAWFIPLLWLSGGALRYYQTLQTYYLNFNTTTSIVSGGGLWGLSRNLRKLSMYTLYGGSLAMLPAFAYGAWRLVQPEGILRRRRFWVLALWMVPSLLFYTFIHMGQQGLVFVFLPALFIISVESLRRLTASRRLLWWGVAGGVVVFNLALFLVVPTFPLGGERFKILTWDTIRRQDAYYQDRLAVVQREFTPNNTALVGSNWRHLQYYLPAYPLIRFGIISKWELGEGQARNPWQETQAFTPQELGLTPAADGTCFVILFDDNLVAFNDTPQRAATHPLPGGGQLTYLELRKGDRFYLGPDSFGIASEAEVTSQ
jgi:4-amino-4-deoxy-L-arabinose transferase-like glycosyltransferase